MVYAHGGKSVSIPSFYTRVSTLSQALLLTFQWSLYLPDPHPLTLLASLLFTLYLDLCRLHMLVCFLNELWNCIRFSSYLLQRLFFLLRTGWRQLLFWLLSELLRLFPFPWKERTTWEDECRPCQCHCCVQTEQRWANNYIFKKKKTTDVCTKLEYTRKWSWSCSTGPLESQLFSVLGKSSKENNECIIKLLLCMLT